MKLMLAVANVVNITNKHNLGDRKPRYKSFRLQIDLVSQPPPHNLHLCACPGSQSDIFGILKRRKQHCRPGIVTLSPTIESVALSMFPW